MRAPALLMAIGCLAAALAGCSEEDRRAWVSILPLRDDAEPDTMPAGPRVFAMTADSSAVLLGADTLFSVGRLPSRGPGGSPLAARHFERVAFSPDSLMIAFATDGGTVGVWSRPQQVAYLAAAFPAGVDTLAWAPAGRWLGYQGRRPGAPPAVAIYDAQLGRRVEHAVAAWFGETERSVTLQGWIDDDRLRVLVAPGAEPAGGLAYAWQADAGTLIAESHQAPLAERAPPGARLEAGGVWSLDLTGDGAPETVALYRAATGAPGAVVLESVGAGYRAAVTEPLVALEALGLESWEGTGRVGLDLVVDLGGRPVLVLGLPSPEPPLRALGLFHARPSARLEPVLAVTPDGPRPALFLDGQSGDGTVQLGLVDLDGDGQREVVSATGRVESGAAGPSVRWQVLVFRWAGGRLEPAPELEGAALERIARVTGGPAAAPDTARAAP